MEVIIELYNGIPEEPKLFSSEENAFNYYVERCKENNVEFTIEPNYPDTLMTTLEDADNFLRDYVGAWEIQWWGSLKADDE